MAAPHRTKLVVTVGPALDPPGALERVLEAGADVLRVNLSHGPPATHVPRLVRARAHRPEVAVLADLGGPKLRLGDLPAPVTLPSGSTVVLGPGGLGVSDPDFAQRVRPGDPVYLADGTLRLEARLIAGANVECVVLVGGTVTSRKGVNLPADASELPCLTEKDRSDLVTLDLLRPDFVALSYVRHEADVHALRALTPVPIIAKIEKQQALERLEAILAASDGVMVARGDLGVEIPIERVPGVQKRLIRAANAAAKPVITATQMLVSMVSNPLPTRAEVTDVANAVLDGTDAVMLSEETSVGAHPSTVVETMVRIVREAEALLPAATNEGRERAAESEIARAAVTLARDLDAAAILVPTLTGSSALRVAQFRPRVPVLAFSPRAETVRRLALSWGVVARPLPTTDTGAAVVSSALAAAREVLPAGARVVVIAGWPPGGAARATSFIHVATL